MSKLPACSWLEAIPAKPNERSFFCCGVTLGKCLEDDTKASMQNAECIKQHISHMHLLAARASIVAFIPVSRSPHDIHHRAVSNASLYLRANLEVKFARDIAGALDAILVQAHNASLTERPAQPQRSPPWLPRCAY